MMPVRAENYRHDVPPRHLIKSGIGVSMMANCAAAGRLWNVVSKQGGLSHPQVLNLPVFFSF